MTHYTRNGKEILRDGQHFGEAIDELGAMEILNALLHIEGYAPARSAPTACIRTQQNDEMACSCGLRWEVNDSDPHETS